MTRAGLIFAGAVVTASVLSIGVYAMKYEVERLDEQFAALQRKLMQQEEMLQVLEAEWTFLNRPERLKELAARHLDLKPVAVRQLTAIDTLPFRPTAQQQQQTAAQTENRVPLPRYTPALSPAQATQVGKREAP